MKALRIVAIAVVLLVAIIAAIGALLAWLLGPDQELAWMLDVDDDELERRLRAEASR